MQDFTTPSLWIFRVQIYFSEYQMRVQSSIKYKNLLQIYKSRKLLQRQEKNSLQKDVCTRCFKRYDGLTHVALKINWMHIQ